LSRLRVVFSQAAVAPALLFHRFVLGKVRNTLSNSDRVSEPRDNSKSKK